MRSVEAEELTGASGYAAGVPSSEPVMALGEPELDSGLLPRDHPRWVRDAIAISKAARDLVTRLRPIVTIVMSIWDHPLRYIAVSGRRVGIDASGSYRIEV